MKPPLRFAFFGAGFWAACQLAAWQELQGARCVAIYNHAAVLRRVRGIHPRRLGTHILNVSRFLFGEADSVFCRTQQVHKHIKGEDVATVMLGMKSGATVTCHLALAENFVERECFPQTLFFVEGAKGSIEVAPDYWVRVTTKDGTRAEHFPPPRYAWADPA